MNKEGLLSRMGTEAGISVVQQRSPQCCSHAAQFKEIALSLICLSTASVCQSNFLPCMR